MNKYFIFILILMGSVLISNAQTNIEMSPFVNVPIAVKLYPLPKHLKEKSKSKDKVFVDGFTEETPIDFDLKINSFRQSDGNTAVFFTSLIDNKELAFEDINQAQIARVEIFAKITSLDKKVGGIFEDKVIFSVNNTNTKPIALNGKQSYVKGVILPSGEYRILFIIRDSVTGKTAARFPKFTISSQ